ncbi:hypothetical protein ABFS83_03G077600 [Erythranthe nasuta]
MASTSFALPNQFTGRRFPAAPPQLSQNLRQTMRVSARYATAERTSSSSFSAAGAGESGNSISHTASFYDVLGIQAGATSQEIKSAYRSLARTVHPDVAPNSADEFMRVHAAYATLSDPEQRAVYDSSLFRMRRRTTVVSMGGGGYSEMSRGRRWETDQCW